MTPLIVKIGMTLLAIGMAGTLLITSFLECTEKTKTIAEGFVVLTFAGALLLIVRILAEMWGVV